MNRRSFLSWLGLAPAALPALARDRSALITAGADVQAGGLAISRKAFVAAHGANPATILDDMAAERAQRAGEYTLFTNDSLQAFLDRYPARPCSDVMQLPAGWAGASGGDGRGPAPQTAARPPIANISPFPAVTRTRSCSGHGHGRIDAAGPGGPAAALAAGCVS